MSLDSAKNLAVVLAIGLAVLAVGSAWVVKNITAKVVTIIILGGLGLGMWSQRQSLQDCAKKIRDRGAVGATTTSVTCKFMGTEIKVPPVTVP